LPYVAVLPPADLHQSLGRIESSKRHPGFVGHDHMPEAGLQGLVWMYGEDGRGRGVALSGRVGQFLACVEITAPQVLSTTRSNRDHPDPARHQTQPRMPLQTRTFIAMPTFFPSSDFRADSTSSSLDSCSFALAIYRAMSCLASAVFASASMFSRNLADCS
jgi:hypothetical protein